MRPLTTLRFRQLRAPRLVAAIFAIGWLGFAVAPCQAMPHQQHPGTSHHGSMPAGDCDHCPTARSDLDNGCATAATSDCMSVGPALLERQGTEVPQPVAAPPPAFPVFDAFISDDGPMRDIRARQLPVSHVSIQQRYCTYLK